MRHCGMQQTNYSLTVVSALTPALRTFYLDYELSVCECMSQWFMRRMTGGSWGLPGQIVEGPTGQLKCWGRGGGFLRRP